MSEGMVRIEDTGTPYVREVFCGACDTFLGVNHAGVHSLAECLKVLGDRIRRLEEATDE